MCFHFCFCFFSWYSNANVILFYHASFWLGWVVCFYRWHASLDCMSGVVTWITFYYYCYYYYWNTILKTKNVGCLLLKQKLKNVPWFEQWFKRRTWLEEQVLVYTIWTGKTRILNMPESTEIYPNMGKYSSINETKNVTLWIYLHMCETLWA